MYIYEATKARTETKPFITRAVWEGRIYIDPTNGPEGCIVHAKNRAPCPRWEPGADDLTADDWKITEGFPHELSINVEAVSHVICSGGLHIPEPIIRRVVRDTIKHPNCSEEKKQ